MNKKRLLALLLAGVMGMSLTACGEKKADDLWKARLPIQLPPIPWTS